MRYMQEMGLNLENCEGWLERAVFAVLAVLYVIMIIRVSLSSYCYTMLINSLDFSFISFLQYHFIIPT